METNVVTINGKKREVLKDTDVALNNGSLVIHYNATKKVIGTYIVTSFRGTLQQGQNKCNYCTLINLQTGYPQFEERASRKTTVARLLSHLCEGFGLGENARRRGEYIAVFPVGKYKIDLECESANNLLNTENEF